MLKQKNALNNWLKKILPDCDYKINTLAGDASLRRYYRIQYAAKSMILMDSAYDKNALHAFLNITQQLANCNTPVPNIYAVEENQGFALIEDFGDDLLLEVVNNDNANELYTPAIKLICSLQESSPNLSGHPAFDKTYIMKELQLFREWFLNKYLNIVLSPAEEKVLDSTFEFLAASLISQPQTFSHMDYHSRNIIVRPVNAESQLGIIDYQDAKIAPFTYDLVSLIKDCYIQWPHEKIIRWVKFFLQETKVKHSYSESDFIKALDLCGLQRHLKVLGIFSRLYIRDKKLSYVDNMPLIFHYILSCLECYTETADFHEIVRLKIYPNYKYEKSDDSSRGTR